MKTKRRKIYKNYNKKSYRKKFIKRKKSYKKNKFRNLKGKGLFFKSKKQKTPEIHYVVHRHDPNFESTREAFMHFTPKIPIQSLMYPSPLYPPPSYFETTDKKNYDEFYKLIVKQKEIKIKCKHLEEQKIELDNNVLYIDTLIANKKSYLTTGIGSRDIKKTNKEIEKYTSKKNSIKHTLIPKIEKELKEATDKYKNNENMLETEYKSYYNEYKSNLTAYKYDA